MRALPAVAALTALSLPGCATLPNGQRWGGNVMGLGASRERVGFTPLPGGGALTFAIALGD
ncbi:MAG: hypothetical protein ACREUL_18120 [Steroidobacteraceae bacterium]